jgi:hypothetical protein
MRAVIPECGHLVVRLIEESFDSTEACLRNKAHVIMAKPPLDPPVADQAPAAGDLTSYDHEHLVTYLRLLDANAEGADWTEIARIVLHIDPSREPERARRTVESHLSRAKWMTEHGYQHLLRGSSPG